jgi:hypothetical protein
MAVQDWIIQDVRFGRWVDPHLGVLQRRMVAPRTQKSRIGDVSDLHISRLCVFLGKTHLIGHAFMNKKIKRQLITATLILVGLFVVFAIVSRIA